MIPRWLMFFIVYFFLFELWILTNSLLFFEVSHCSDLCDPELLSLFPPDAAEVGGAVLVAGWAGAGCGDPGPLPRPLQLCVWMRHRLRLCPSLQISQRYPTDLLPLWCCQRQHQCASVSRHSLWTHNTTTGNKSDSYFNQINITENQRVKYKINPPVLLFEHL